MTETIEKRLEKLAQARRLAEQKEEQDHPRKVPVADPEAKILPNKGGGYAPNYTRTLRVRPMATTDGEQGFIVDADVITDGAEATVQTAAMGRIAENFGRLPQTALGDGAYGAGQNMSALGELGVEILTPMKHDIPTGDNPARRDDPTRTETVRADRAFRAVGETAAAPGWTV